MRYKYWKHIKTGKLYELISDNFMFKDAYPFMYLHRDKDKQYIEEVYNKKRWRKGLYLYKALYEPCPDGPYFARLEDDFLENFIPVTADE